MRLRSHACVCEPFALASGINRMPLNLAALEPKPDARPDASAFGSPGPNKASVLDFAECVLLVQKAD